MELLLVVLFIAALALYFLPSIIADARKAEHRTSIFILTLFLGWTVIGWLAALIWACTDKERVTGRQPCPFCAEMILPEAKVCPHCRRDLPASSASEDFFGPIKHQIPWGNYAVSFGIAVVVFGIIYLMDRPF